MPGRTPRDAQAPRDAAGGPLPHFVAPDDSLLPVVARSLLAPAGDGAVLCPRVAIYGPSGTGKTHLAFGLAQLFREQRRPAAIYLPAADLTQACTGPENADRLSRLKEEICQAGFLALDDLDRLTGRAKDQEMVVRLLDELEDNGASLVCTLGAPPRDCGFLPGLESRLAAMVQVALSPPDVGVRRALFEDWAAALDVVLPAETADYLAREVEGTARDLRGLLVTFAAGQAGRGQSRRALDLASARRLVAAWSADRGVPLRLVALATARHFSLRLRDLRTASRRRELVTARCVAMFLARRLTRGTLDAIGEYFGGRDHTTVLHGCRRIEELLPQDPCLRQAVAHLGQALGLPAAG